MDQSEAILTFTCNSTERRVLMSLLKQTIAIFFVVLITACDSGSSSESAAAPAATKAVWDTTNWDEKDWQ